MQVFRTKIAGFYPYKTQTKPFGFSRVWTVGFGRARVSLWKSGSGSGLSKIVGCRVLAGFLETQSITSQNEMFFQLVSFNFIHETMISIQWEFGTEPQPSLPLNYMWR